MNSGMILNFIQWLSTDPLPDSPEPRSCYVIVDVLKKTYREVYTDSQGNFIEQEQDKELGYGLIENTLHTKDNPYYFNANEPFIFPLRSDNIVGEQHSEAILELIDSLTNKIRVSNLSDLFIIRLEFKMKTVLSDRKGIFEFNIGTDDRFNTKSFRGSEDADKAKVVSEELLFFQGDTFKQNGAVVETTIDGDGEIYDIKVLAKKLNNGKNI